jgi:hypothetical protein
VEDVVRARGERLGHAEVGHHRDAMGEEYVVRLDVAVHHRLRVGVGQRARHVAQDPDRIDHRQLAVPQQPVAQRFAGHVRHGEPGEPAGVAGGEERDDVRMAELGGELDLSAEPVHAHARGQLGEEHLHHDLAAERGLEGQEDPAHSPAPQLALEPVGLAQGLLQLVPEVRDHARI